MLVWVLREASGETPPWHLPAWSHRAVIEVAGGADSAQGDAAGTRIFTCGNLKKDGSDLRLLDEKGAPVPFQLWFAVPDRYAQIAFRWTPAPGRRFYAYWGNATAKADPAMIPPDYRPGSGPPRGYPWLPRQGLIMVTMERPEGTNPTNEAEMARMIAGSPRLHGARFQRRISDCLNPFGPSDNYLTVYRGWITLPRKGRYFFCTASNEGSFSFLDGRPLVHWPGRHTEERGQYGEKNAMVELEAGQHYIEYYHEEVALQQLAFLGWKPEGQRYFTGIPESVYPALIGTQIIRHESNAEGALPVFEPALVDSYWPPERVAEQYTRFRFLPVGESAGDRKIAWSFGDGLAGEGATGEHVYLKRGNFPVKASAAGGRASFIWPLDVYTIEHDQSGPPAAIAATYAGLVCATSVAQLDTASQFEAAALGLDAGRHADAFRIASALIDRAPPLEPDARLAAWLIAAAAAMALDNTSVSNALACAEPDWYRGTNSLLRLRALRARLELTERVEGLAALAPAMVTNAENIVRASDKNYNIIQAYRNILLVAGDMMVTDPATKSVALEYFQRAELHGKTIPAQVRAARIGSYPETIKANLARNNFAGARDVVRRWEDDFPTERAWGHSAYWAGRIEYSAGKWQESARLLARALRLAAGGDFETAARALRAEALEKLGRDAEARQEWETLAASGINDELVRKAREKVGTRQK